MDWIGLDWVILCNTFCGLDWIGLGPTEKNRHNRVAS